MSRSKKPENTTLLRLARELAALANERQAPAHALNAALLRLMPRPDVPRRPARPKQKLQELERAWAREQACLALADLIERAARVGAARRDVSPPLLAWLVLAAADTLAHEPVDAVGDRVQMLRDFLQLPRD
jgi:hypothetical protein